MKKMILILAVLWFGLNAFAKSVQADDYNTAVVAHVIKENKDVHVLMSDYNYDEHNELSDGGNTTVIPTKNVINKFLIKGL